ncbi:unnamed protein product [Candidula unifasciata]|uniref:DUF885 domain-containing protein n=1 Tax=Candidula unifasciata TaxID=100452 RepID=A0A8S3YZ70_9EUPU|nr:unnamed protein product [Candidula unifasciata]
MPTSDAAVLALCDEVWKWRLDQSPELATFCGFHQYDDRWDDISEESCLKKEKTVAEFLKRAEALETADCTPDVALSHALLVEDLKLYLRGSAFKSYLMPISYLEGIHLDFDLTLSYMKYDTEEDFNKYLSRLQKLPQRIEQVIVLLKKGVEEGIVQFSTSVNRVPKQIESILNTAIDEQAFLKPFTEEHPQVPKEQLEKIQVTARDLVKSAIVPALKALKTYIEEEYSIHVRPGEGISTIKDGLQWYQQCLNFHLTCSMTPQQVHDLGLKEVARIHERIFQVAEKEQLGKTCPEIMEAITKRQKGHFKTKDEILEYVKNLCYKKIQPKLSQLFGNLPDLPMKIEAAPESRKDAPMGMYLNGTPDGSREGHYYINNHNLDECLPYQFPALSLHEGEPGHHLQGVYALAATHLPDFRRYAEDSKYYLAPARFSFNTAYVEGWGLYSESLGEELNVYEDNFELLGRYGFESFRAARLVVDTGLHAFGWSKEQAVKYMVDNVLTPQAEMAREVERYITWPGQACAYKVGEIKIWELRRKAENILGTQFDIREFHHQILSCGAVPLTVLEMIVDQYIESAKLRQQPGH